jgi:hypothetical protein
MQRPGAGDELPEDGFGQRLTLPFVAQLKSIPTAVAV